MSVLTVDLLLLCILACPLGIDGLKMCHFLFLVLCLGLCILNHIAGTILSYRDLERLSDTLSWKIICHVELDCFGEEIVDFFFPTDFYVELFNLAKKTDWKKYLHESA